MMAADRQDTTDTLQNGRVYRFGKGMDDNSVLTSGWGEPERGFVWSHGRASVIMLHALAGENVLSISLWGYIPTGVAAQEVLVFVNGNMKGMFEISEKTTIHVSHHSHVAESLCVTFYMPTAVSPFEAEGANDRRVLGIALAVAVLRNKGG